MKSLTDFTFKGLQTKIATAVADTADTDMVREGFPAKLRSDLKGEQEFTVQPELLEGGGGLYTRGTMETKSWRREEKHGPVSKLKGSEWLQQGKERQQSLWPHSEL
jgi:hypothetical protein